MRLFASLSLPEDPAEHLDAAVRSVDASVPDSTAGRSRSALRWVPSEQRHITLAFYGEIPSGAVDALTAGLQDALAGVVPFPVRLRGAGVFSGRTLWMGVQESGVQEAGAGEGRVQEGHSRRTTPLMELMAAAETAAAHPARNPEAVRDRRRAHVTLARARDKRRGEGELRRRAEALAVYEGPAWTVREAQLMLSELGQGRSGGPLHTELARIPLAHPAAG